MTLRLAGNEPSGAKGQTCQMTVKIIRSGDAWPCSTRVLFLRHGLLFITELALYLFIKVATLRSRIRAVFLKGTST